MFPSPLKKKPHAYLNQCVLKQLEKNFEHCKFKTEPAGLQTTIAICLSLIDFGLYFIRVYQLCIILFSRRMTNISPLHPSSKCLLFPSRRASNSSCQSVSFPPAFGAGCGGSDFSKHMFSHRNRQMISSREEKKNKPQKTNSSSGMLCLYIYHFSMSVLPNIV